MSLYIKHRPKNFNEFVGNEEVVASLNSILSRHDCIPHVFLFEGDYGCGKTTLAYILAKELGCDEDEIQYMDIGTFRKVENADQIKEQIQYLPLSGKNKVYILDEIQTTTGSKFQESLLHTLEHPPDYVYFVICTTNISKINKGILSRSTIFSLRNYTIRELIRILKSVIEKEKKEIDDEIIRFIASRSLNSPREALTNLEKIINYDNIDLEKIRNIVDFANTKDPGHTIPRLIKTLLENKPLYSILNILKQNKLNPEEIRRGVIAYCYAIIIKIDNGKYNPNIITIYQIFIEKENIDKYQLLNLCILAWETICE